MTKYYTGIGARKVPVEICLFMGGVAKRMPELGYTLRSGAADGSDSAFEFGCHKVGGQGDIFLPKVGFKGRDILMPINGCTYHVQHGDMQRKAADILRETNVCGFIDKVNIDTYNFFTRNVYQLLGLNLDTPSKVVIYYAPEKDGECQGGTRIAVNLAPHYGIPTYNLLHAEQREKIKELLNES